jgi:hypothetical protein
MDKISNEHQTRLTGIGNIAQINCPPLCLGALVVGMFPGSGRLSCSVLIIPY